MSSSEVCRPPTSPPLENKNLMRGRQAAHSAVAGIQSEQLALQDSAPIEQREAPSIQEYLEVFPNDGPRPLTIAEYRARQEKKEKKKTKRGGQVRKLLQQKRLQQDLLAAATTSEDRQRYIECINDLKAQLKLRNRAKPRKGAANMRKP